MIPGALGQLSVGATHGLSRYVTDNLELFYDAYFNAKTHHADLENSWVDVKQGISTPDMSEQGFTGPMIWEGMAAFKLPYGAYLKTTFAMPQKFCEVVYTGTYTLEFCSRALSATGGAFKLSGFWGGSNGSSGCLEWQLPYTGDANRFKMNINITGSLHRLYSASATSVLPNFNLQNYHTYTFVSNNRVVTAYVDGISLGQVQSTDGTKTSTDGVSGHPNWTLKSMYMFGRKMGGGETLKENCGFPEPTTTTIYDSNSKLKAIRLYSVALTPAQVKRNVGADKARLIF